MDVTAAKLLNFAEPLDVTLLDTTVNAFYGAGSNDQVRGVPAGIGTTRPEGGRTLGPWGLACAC